MFDRSAAGRARMRFYGFVIVTLNEAEDEGCSACGPSLRVCFSDGRPALETKHNVREAVRQHSPL